MSADYFERVRATYIENWPAALHELSIPHVGVRLGLGEAHALGLRNPRFRSPEGAPEPEPLDRVTRELGAAVARFPEGAFVRLGSRSAKDSERALVFGSRVRSAEAALATLVDGSQRTAFDLRLALLRGYEPHVFARRWTDIPPWAEFRCFVRGRALVGVSQYDVRGAGPSPEVARDAAAIRAAVGRLFARLRDALHVADVVADVFLEGGAPYEARLLELNPFGPNTDACLFTWEGGGDFDGSFRYVGESGETGHG